jgi:SET domain-containing protein
MKTVEEFLNSLADVYCRLKPSKYGIGVFAIRKIPKGTNPFIGCFDGEFIEIEKDIIDSLQDKEVKQYIIDLAPLQDEKFFVPSCGLQRVDLSFFLNHSKEPNMIEEGEGVDFIAARDIEIGEELTVDYTTYDDYSKTDESLK